MGKIVFSISAAGITGFLYGENKQTYLDLFTLYTNIKHKQIKKTSRRKQKKKNLCYFEVQ